VAIRASAALYFLLLAVFFKENQSCFRTIAQIVIYSGWRRRRRRNRAVHHSKQHSRRERRRKRKRTLRGEQRRKLPVKTKKQKNMRPTPPFGSPALLTGM